MSMQNALPADVEASLGEAWSFLTGEAMQFREIAGDGCRAGRGEHFLVALNPADVTWRAGVVLFLSFAESASRPGQGKEICNIFSGCLAPVFARRDEFIVGLPDMIDESAVNAILDSRTYSRCYANAEGSVRILAFELGGEHPPANGRSARGYLS